MTEQQNIETIENNAVEAAVEENSAPSVEAAVEAAAEKAAAEKAAAKKAAAKKAAAKKAAAKKAAAEKAAAKKAAAEKNYLSDGTEIPSGFSRVISTDLQIGDLLFGVKGNAGDESPNGKAPSEAYTEKLVYIRESGRTRGGTQRNSALFLRPTSGPSPREVRKAYKAFSMTVWAKQKDQPEPLRFSEADWKKRNKKA